MADYSYIAFLDILGYKNLLDHDIKNGTQIFKSKMIEPSLHIKSYPTPYL